MDAAKRFRNPENTLGDFDTDTAARLIAAVADVALIVDRHGVVQDMTVGNDDLPLVEGDNWLGRHWNEIVTVESRPKVDVLLQDAARKTPSRWRQLNHPSSQGGPDVPIMYSTVGVGRGDQIIAVGRDLRAVAALQQRLIEAQQSMEQDYARLRQAETRYRVLFQLAAEAVLIVDAADLKIVEANPAAGSLLGEHAKQLTGKVFPDVFEEDNSQILQTLLFTARSTGRVEKMQLHPAQGQQPLAVSVSLFRQGNSAHFLVRLFVIPTVEDVAELPKRRADALAVIDGLPDAFVITDPDGLVLTGNRAFIDLVQLVTEEQIKGKSLGQWLGRPNVDLNVLLSNLRQHGAVRLFVTTLQGEYGSAAEVEISAVSVTGDAQPCLGFAIRHIGRRLSTQSSTGRELPRSVEQMTELVGRVSLKELVRDTTDMIERLCIEAALELTGDNRASAAELLGLSRQSLYVKLRRYGLGDLTPSGSPDGH